MDHNRMHWWGEEPFPWLLAAGFAVGGILLAGVGAFVACEVIDGLEKFCQ